MNYMKNLALIAVCLVLATVFGATASAQSDTVYVSGGATIYKVSGGTASAIVTVSGSNFESIAIGPDNVDDPAVPFLIYACDTNTNTIMRFNPAAPNSRDFTAPVSGLVPECGRSAASGDFYVTNKALANNAGRLYKITNAANTPLGSLGAVTLISVPAGLPNTLSGRGLSQKNTGDLLIVDNAGKQVLNSPYNSSFTTQSTFTNTNLNSPIGIARVSSGDVFVANGNLGSGRTAVPPVAHFDRAGSSTGISCPSLTFNSNQTPGYLAATQADTIYLVTAANNKSTVWSWNAAQTTTPANCTLVSQATLSAAVTGVAVGPGSFPTIQHDINSSTNPPTPTTFDFHSNAFQITADGCTGTVRPFLMSPTFLRNIVIGTDTLNPDPISNPVTALNLGEAGYEVAYDAKWLTPPVNPACKAAPGDMDFVTKIFGFYDNGIINNPRVVRCEGTPDALTSCVGLATIGEYPLGGILPGDGGTAVRSPTNSIFFLVNDGVPGASASFCGFQSPLNSKQPATFKLGATKTISVKFKLGDGSPNSCQNGPYITTANALISVALIKDAKGQDFIGDVPVFKAIPISSTSVGNADQQPLFNQGNQQYQFTLDISGFAVGTYSLNVTFLTSNTTMQTITFKVTN